MVTHRERIVEYLKRSREGADDDILAEALDISPRQTVNQVCRKLAAEGLVSRRKEARGPLPHRRKIVNRWTGSP